MNRSSSREHRVETGAVEPLESRNTLPTGQAMEFRVWSEMIQQSRGLLHVFLPLLDRGLDAVIHRRTDGDYIPVQVKSRGEVVDGKIGIMVPGSRLVDDRALLIAGLFTNAGLGPLLLVVDEGTFKRLAAHGTGDIYSTWVSLHPRSTRWKPYMVPREQLAQRLLGEAPANVGTRLSDDERLKPVDRHDQWLGFLGEAEVVRRLAQNPRLDLFRPFPDLEMVEVLARDNVTGQFIGLQVKAATPGYHGEAHVSVRKASFVAASTTWIVVVAWIAELGRFADECLVVPTPDLGRIAVDDGVVWVLNFRPESTTPGQLDPYRRQLADLGGVIGQVISGS